MLRVTGPRLSRFLSGPTLGLGRRFLRRYLRRLLALDRHQHLLLTRRCLARLLGRLFWRPGLGLSGSAPDAPPQRFHQIDDVLALRSFLWRDRLASALLIDEIDQRCLIVI